MKKVLAILLTLTSIASFANHRVDISKVHARVEPTKPFSSQQHAILIAKTISSATNAAVIMSKTHVIAKKPATMLG